jgi:hypothetical protein
VNNPVHLRIRLASLIAIGAILNLAQPGTARAAPAAMCGGCVDACPSNLLDFCAGCNPSGPTCYLEVGCSDPGFRYLVLCSPI